MNNIYLAILSLLLTLTLNSCGTTRTSVKTFGKGVANATIQVTTNNPTSVSVETKIDSTSLKINKK